MKPRPRALFFDVGETLVYPHPSSGEVISAACRQAGFDVTPAQVEAVEAAVAPRIAERQAGGELYSISAESSRRFWSWVYRQILGDLGVPPDLHESLGEHFHTHFNAFDTWRLYADSLPVLEALQPRRREGLVLGIISNWEDWLEALLSHLAVDRFFEFAIVSSDVRFEKPDAAIFHAALDRAGVAAAEAMHVGDSVYADVEGARGAGITPVLLDRRRRYDARSQDVPPGTHVIHELGQLIPLLS